jgi:hypothetical protein
MVIKFKRELVKITTQWRLTAKKTRLIAGEIPNLSARGHMHGVSDGLDVAADDIAGLLEKDVPPPSS